MQNGQNGTRRQGHQLTSTAARHFPRSADFQSISICRNRSISRRFFVQVQQALCLSVTTTFVAACPRCAVSPISNRQPCESSSALSPIKSESVLRSGTLHL